MSTYSYFTSGALVSSDYFDTLRLLPVELHQPHLKLQLSLKANNRYECKNVERLKKKKMLKNSGIILTFMSFTTSGTGATSWCLKQEGINHRFIFVVKNDSDGSPWEHMDPSVNCSAKEIRGINCFRSTNVPISCQLCTHIHRLPTVVRGNNGGLLHS